jgi:hypothetical protein
MYVQRNSTESSASCVRTHAALIAAFNQQLTDPAAKPPVSLAILTRLIK